MALIELRGVSKIYEQPEGAVHALKDINLQIERSDIYGIIVCPVPEKALW